MNQTGHCSVQMAQRYIRDGSLFQENSAGKLRLIIEPCASHLPVPGPLPHQNVDSVTAVADIRRYILDEILFRGESAGKLERCRNCKRSGVEALIHRFAC
jgi:hypothetical protein